MEPAARAAAILRSLAPDVGDEIARLERRHIGVRHLDSAIHAQRATAAVRAIAEFLSTGEMERTLSTLQDLLELQAHNGMKPADFAEMGFFYLAAMRRAVVRGAPSVEEGLEAWEAAEERLLPQMRTYLEMCLTAGESEDRRLA